MSQSPYRFSAFVNDLRKMTRDTANEDVLLQRIAPLAQEAALSQDWHTDHTGEPAPEEDFILSPLHLEDDNSLYIVAITWLPGAITPVHNHNTWAVAVGVEGCETHTLWELSGQPEQRKDLGLSRGKVISVGRGDVLTMPSRGIHSVENRSQQNTVSFHVYGKSLLHTDRFRFFPETDSAESYY
ncbi:hypothetical protein ACWJJH_03650 [Endozoicomonadaceae bacterium StTr2]